MNAPRAILIVLILGSLLVACGSGESPATAAREWVEAQMKLDGLTALERTCAAQQMNVQTTGALNSAVMILARQFIGQQNVNADMSGLQYDTISQSGNQAQVRVHGTISAAVLAFAVRRPVDETYNMVYEDGKWKWCGASGANVFGIPTLISAEASPPISPTTTPVQTNAQTTNISQPLNGVESARAELSFGSGTNKVYALGDSSNLIEGQLHTYSTPNFSVSTSGNQATINLSPGPVSVPMVIPAVSEETWDVGLNSSVTYQIDLNAGVGQSKIDLTKLHLSGGGINGGVGTSDLYLPGKGTYQLTINGGVGAIRIYVPSGLAVRAEVNGGLGSFNQLPSMQEARENVYETPGFSTADNAVTLLINGGVGSISMYESE